MHGQSSVISQGHYVPSNLLVAWQPSKWFLLYWPRCKFHVQWYWHYQEMWTVCFVRVTWLWRTVCYCQCKAVALGILNCGHVYVNTVRCMYACMYVWMFASVHGSQPKRTTATENISFTFTTSLLFFFHYFNPLQTCQFYLLSFTLDICLSYLCVVCVDISW